MFAAFLADYEGYSWLPRSASSSAPWADGVFYLILAVCVIFFVPMMAVMVYFVVRYHARDGVHAQPTATHNTYLELAWTIVPLVVVMIIFTFGFRAYMVMITPPDGAYDINVTAYKYGWRFTYPNGVKVDKLHAPVDRPVRLIMTSTDLIHSLSIPDFRVKMDCVPGRTTYTWFEANAAGTYDLYCTEYCGALTSPDGQQRGHSDMYTHVIIHEPGKFEPWLANEADFVKNMPPSEAGERLWEMNCKQCHTNDGSAGVGPTLKGIWGAEHRFSDGSSSVVDENYLRRSIYDPNSQVRAGYLPQMPTFQGQLSEEEVGAITAYVKSLGD